LEIPAVPEIPSATVTVKITGDIVFPATIPSGADYFYKVKDVLKADLLVGNLEGPITSYEERRTRPNRRTVFSFRFEPVKAPALLRKAGFDRIFLANNHTWDYDEQGLRDTVSNLSRAGISAIGLTNGYGRDAENGITRVTVSNRTIAFVGIYFSPRFHDMHDTNRAYRLIRTARSNSDAVIVILHAGAEGKKALHVKDDEEKFVGVWRGNSVAFSRFAIRSGADCVIGLGPHVVRAVERYQGKYILYSIGNFLPVGGLKTDGVQAYGAVAELTVEGGRKGIGVVRLIPVVFGPDRCPASDPDGGALRLMRSLTEAHYSQTVGLQMDFAIGEDGVIRSVD
jgi:poly-gamma-glutamate capsule biosynthesis protein CapA/YwtB (metallophosphatase superfamily)